MKSKSIILLTSILLVLCTFTISSAEVSVSVALKTGLNLANVRGDDASGTDTRTGMVTGLSAALNFGEAVSFVSEFLYIMKGTKYREGNLTTAVKLGYIEIPLMLQITVPTDGPVAPFLYAGPAASSNISSKLGYSSSGSASTDIEVDNVREANLGWITGGGVKFDLSRATVGLEIRYERGFMKIVDDPLPNGTNIEYNGTTPDWKHSDLTLMVGVFF